MEYIKTPLHRKNLSVALMENKNGIGKRSQDFKLNRRSQMLGDKNPMFDNFGKKHHFYGKHHKSETIQKIKVAAIKTTNEECYKNNLSVKMKKVMSSSIVRAKLKKSAIEYFFAHPGNNSGRKYPLEGYPNYGIRKIRKDLIIPKKDTSIEIKIQIFLKELDIMFFAHQYIKSIEHGYQCDILVPSLNLVIECDGDYWHKYPIGNDIDIVRTIELTEKGFKVLRLWECEIKKLNLEAFKEKLEKSSYN